MSRPANGPTRRSRQLVRQQIFPPPQFRLLEGLTIHCHIHTRNVRFVEQRGGRSAAADRVHERQANQRGHAQAAARGLPCEAHRRHSHGAHLHLPERRPRCGRNSSLGVDCSRSVFSRSRCGITAAIHIDFPAGYVDEFESWPPVRPRKPLHLKELNSLDVFVKSLNEVPFRCFAIALLLSVTDRALALGFRL